MPATVTTPESLATTVRLSFYRVNVQALMALLGRVGWRNGNNSNPSTQGLVLDEHSQLIKCPRI
jgi:hypothetical protein